MKKETGPKIVEKSWAVIFLHAEGWTVSSLESRRHYAQAEMKRQKESLPDFKYKVVPVEISFDTP